MMDWWRSREPREQLLLAAAGLVAVVVALVQGVWAPVASAREEAGGRRERASRDLATIQQGVAVMSGPDSGSQSAPPNPETFRAAVVASARERGLSINRLQTGPGGEVSVSMDDADPRVLFSWLAETRTLPGGEVISAAINNRGGGSVRAVVEFQGGRRR